MGVSLTVPRLLQKRRVGTKDCFRRSGDKVIYDWLPFSLHSYGSSLPRVIWATVLWKVRRVLPMGI